MMLLTKTVGIDELNLEYHQPIITLKNLHMKYNAKKIKIFKDFLEADSIVNEIPFRTPAYNDFNFFFESLNESVVEKYDDETLKFEKDEFTFAFFSDCNEELELYFTYHEEFASSGNIVKLLDCYENNGFFPILKSRKEDIDTINIANFPCIIYSPDEHERIDLMHKIILSMKLPYIENVKKFDRKKSRREEAVNYKKGDIIANIKSELFLYLGKQMPSVTTSIDDQILFQATMSEVENEEKDVQEDIERHLYVPLKQDTTERNIWFSDSTWSLDNDNVIVTNITPYNFESFLGCPRLEFRKMRKTKIITSIDLNEIEDRSNDIKVKLKNNIDVIEVDGEGYSYLRFKKRLANFIFLLGYEKYHPEYLDFNTFVGPIGRAVEEFDFDLLLKYGFSTIYNDRKSLVEDAEHIDITIHLSNI